MTDQRKTAIWDLPTRLFHWSLVGLIGYSWYTMEISDNVEHHFISGYCIIALLLFRILWGLWGARYALFRSFLYPLKTTVDYLKRLFVRDTKEYAGHNPVGGLAALALLLTVAVQATSGLFANDGYFVDGPLTKLVSSSLSDTLTDIHHTGFNVLLALIAVHILAVTFYLLYKRQNLILPMITGKKYLDHDGQGIKGSRLGLALLFAVVCAAAVYGISQI